MKIKITGITIFVLLLAGSFALAQSHCDNPLPDTCHVPYMWCPVSPDHCPWDMNINGIDIVFMVNYFKCHPDHVNYPSSLDLNCDGLVNPMDILYLVNYLRGRGPAPDCCVYICQEPQGPGSIGDFVWQDLDGDGIQDPGEPGLPDVQIRIYDCNSDTLVDETQTDSLGHYRSRELGSSHLYRVHFDPPQGYRWSPSNQGNVDTLDSDADTLTGFTACVPAPTERPNNTVDCGMRVVPIPKSSIGDYVWFDADSNGIQDTDEHGIGGVDVELLNCDNEILDTLTTDSTGFFLFVNLNQGDYKLHFIPPFGYRFSPPDQGTNDTLDSDANPMTGLTPCVTLGFADQADIWDAGMYGLSEGENCTRPESFWKNHTGFGHQPDLVTAHLPIWLGMPDSVKSIDDTTAHMAYDILRMHTYGNPSNGITKLYAQLLAAKLNIANGADDSAIATVVATVDAFLSTHDWHAWNGMSHEGKAIIRDWTNMLLRYNVGEIGPGPCEDGNINLQ